MPGKTKDCKANKGKKALENEWELAVQAANSGERLEVLIILNTLCGMFSIYIINEYLL